MSLQIIGGTIWADEFDAGSRVGMRELKGHEAFTALVLLVQDLQLEVKDLQMDKANEP